MTQWCRSRTLAFLALICAAGLLTAWPWTLFAYRGAHLESQGIDIVYHAVLIHQASVPDGRNVHTLGEHLNYPIMSHRLATWTLPLFGGNPFLAMRFVSALTMLVLLAAPFVLLCRVMRPTTALAVVVLWQLLCIKLKVSGFNHFMDEGQYNYSRAVGTAAWWVMLVCLVAAPAHRWGRIVAWTAAVGLACFALACHVAPGGVALGTLIIYGSYEFLRERRARYLGLVVGSFLAGLLMLLATDVWEYMTHNAGSDGWLPVGNLALLLLWVPTLALGCWRLIHELLEASRTRKRPECGERLPTVLPDAYASGSLQGSEAMKIEHIAVAGLLSAGLFQGYLAFKMLALGTCAPYAVKSLFFFTFPLAGFLWIIWGIRYFGAPSPVRGRMGSLMQGVIRPLTGFGSPIWALAAVLLTAFLGYRLAKMDLGMRWQVRDLDTPKRLIRPAPDQLPHQASEALREVAGTFPGYYYFDPIQPTGAYYATLIGLGMEKELARTCYLKSQANPIESLRAIPEIQGVLVPHSVDPSSLAPAGSQIKDARPFWKIQFQKPQPCNNP